LSYFIIGEGVEKGSHLSTTGSKKGQKPAKRA